MRRVFTCFVGSVSGCLAAFLVAGQALADVAPPNMPPGSNIGPEAQTQVQMRAERILIEVAERGQSGYFVSDVASARVSGEFFMRNLGQAEERMQVRFPLADPSGEGSGFFTYPEVQNFVASVDGQLVPAAVSHMPNPQGEEEPPINWATFDVTFPLTREVVITVSYTISPTGYLPEATFAYVLSTGAGWRGPIGRADITLRLPYRATSENVILDTGKTVRGARITRGEVRWTWTNLEPTSRNDWYATILAPSIWRSITDARQAMQKSPRDAGKWLALSKAYISAVPFKYEATGGYGFLRLGLQAMQRAVALAPKSADMHAEFAALLWRLYYFDVIQQPQGVIARRILREIDTALELDPDNAKARALKEEVDRELGIPKG